MVHYADVERWFLRLVCVLDQARQQIDEKVPRATVAGVLDLRDVLQLIVDGLNQRPLTEQYLIQQRHQSIGHVAPDVGCILLTSSSHLLAGHSLYLLHPVTGWTVTYGVVIIGSKDSSSFGKLIG